MSDPERFDATHEADVVVVGDGPAGSALAAACARRAIDVVLVGDDQPWRPTYGIWIDELDGVEGLGDVGAWTRRVTPISAYGERRHELARPYGVVDNEALRARLQTGVERLVGRTVSTRTGVTHHSVAVTGGRRVRCRLIVLATGRSGDPDAIGGRGPAWQTAFGAVLAEPPPGELGRPTLMDFRPPAGGTGAGPTAPTFAYALPVADGWLVEETVLAARPAVDPVVLRRRLAARLGMTDGDLLERAVGSEVVAIPMGGPLPDRDQVIVRFGAAAGYVHPATGFSLSASLRAAPRVADAVGVALAEHDDLAADARMVWDAVWPAAARRTRALHDYGLERMIRFDGAGLREFFDRFFELPTEDWSAYLRVDAAPADVSRTMSRLFRSSSWPMRRRLASGNPLALARLLWP